MKTPLTSQCALCDGTGWRPVQKKDDKGEFRAVEPCSCQATPRSLDWRMDHAQIPARFRDCTFESFFPNDTDLDTALIKARGFAREYPAVNKGLLFIGNPGVGKTHLTVAILKQLMQEKGVDCHFCNYLYLLKRLEESSGPTSLRASSEILEPVLESTVVAIDDFGARRFSEFAEDTVTYVLNYRYDQKRLTLLTTNLPETAEEIKESSPSGIKIRDTLQQRIGVRISSRLFEMCEKVSIRSKDFRQEKHAHERASRRRA